MKSTQRNSSSSSSVNKRSYQGQKTTGAAGDTQIQLDQRVTDVIARSKFPYLADDNIYHMACACSFTIRGTIVVTDKG